MTSWKECCWSGLNTLKDLLNSELSNICLIMVFRLSQRHPSSRELKKHASHCFRDKLHYLTCLASRLIEIARKRNQIVIVIKLYLSLKSLEICKSMYTKVTKPLDTRVWIGRWGSRTIRRFSTFGSLAIRRACRGIYISLKLKSYLIQSFGEGSLLSW